MHYGQVRSCGFSSTPTLTLSFGSQIGGVLLPDEYSKDTTIYLVDIGEYCNGHVVVSIACHRGTCIPGHLDGFYCFLVLGVELSSAYGVQLQKDTTQEKVRITHPKAQQSIANELAGTRVTYLTVIVAIL